MSARDVIADKLAEWGYEDSRTPAMTDGLLKALTASGHRILAPGEAQIIENALRYSREAMTVAGGMPLSDAETIDAIAAALRELMKEVGR